MNGAREMRTRRERVVVESKSGAHPQTRRCLSTMTTLLSIPSIPRPKLARHARACRVRAASSTSLTLFPLELQDCDREGLAGLLWLRFHRIVDADDKPIFVEALQSYT